MDTAQVLIEQLKAVGITAELVPVEWQTWVDDVYRGGTTSPPYAASPPTT